VFADVVGVSKKTVEAWENGRNKPEGAARRLIGMMAKNKNIVQEIVHSR
jgi:putative transcriptional regulator